MISIIVECSPNDSAESSFEQICRLANFMGANVKTDIDGFSVLVEPGDEPIQQYTMFMANKPKRRRNVEPC